MIKNILIAIVGLVLLTAVFVVAKPMLAGHTPSQVACTMEAKICPDGSSVGRTGPNCEFTACPTTSTTHVLFQCSDNKSITADFSQTGVEFYVSDGRNRTFSLKHTPTDDESEARYASDDAKTVLWVRDQSAFLEEDGKTTFAACIAKVDYPQVPQNMGNPQPN